MRNKLRRATSTEQEQEPSVVQTDEKEKEEEPDTGMIERPPDIWSGQFGTFLFLFVRFGFQSVSVHVHGGFLALTDLLSTRIRG